jgi:hypothetical protein
MLAESKEKIRLITSVYDQQNTLYSNKYSYQKKQICYSFPQEFDFSLGFEGIGNFLAESPISLSSQFRKSSGYKSP